jgi:DMSO/TMAO reductase YedYZ molybdopterin-dependent catalytic subunit
MTETQLTNPAKIRSPIVSSANAEKPRKREGINYPKFAEQFSKIDFDAEPMPVLCLYQIPEPMSLSKLQMEVCGLDCKKKAVSWAELESLPRVRMKVPLICQIFNWSEEVEWEGIRLVDFLDYVKLEAPSDGFYAFYSRDGVYFEKLTRNNARDPRVLLATGLNGAPLPEVHGGPLRLVVPFLQGYKSVKWLHSIRAFRRDPVGIKRLLGQSNSGRLGHQWLRRYDITPPSERVAEPL